MRFIRLSEDLSTVVGRSRDEARLGYVQNALARLAELGRDFPNESYIYFEEGLLRFKYLGAMVAARNLFERAYELGTKSHEARDIAGLAAFNSAWLAPNVDQGRLWSNRAL